MEVKFGKIRFLLEEVDNIDDSSKSDNHTLETINIIFEYCKAYLDFERGRYVRLQNRSYILLGFLTGLLSFSMKVVNFKKILAIPSCWEWVLLFMVIAYIVITILSTIFGILSYRITYVSSIPNPKHLIEIYRDDLSYQHDKVKLYQMLSAEYSGACSGYLEMNEEKSRLLNIAYVLLFIGLCFLFIYTIISHFVL